MVNSRIFWLHIKKSAGTTIRKLLKPHYIEVDRKRKPETFIQASVDEYNDILNNYRVPLGDFQFRRCLFAKRYLYGNEWDSLVSFAFSREPVDRCISMFYALFWRDIDMTNEVQESLRRIFRALVHKKKLLYNKSYAFDVFLDCVLEARVGASIYKPFSLNFTTHTAPMKDDIVDLEGKILLKKVFRIENIVFGINRIFEECGIEDRIDENIKSLNKNPYRRTYKPQPSQLTRIYELYGGDFELYESAI